VVVVVVVAVAVTTAAVDKGATASSGDVATALDEDAAPTAADIRPVRTVFRPRAGDLRRVVAIDKGASAGAAVTDLVHSACMTSSSEKWYDMVAGVEVFAQGVVVTTFRVVPRDTADAPPVRGWRGATLGFWSKHSFHSALAISSLQRTACMSMSSSLRVQATKKDELSM
jgi:hypothetical protein